MVNLGYAQNISKLYDLGTKVERKYRFRQFYLRRFGIIIVKWPTFRIVYKGKLKLFEINFPFSKINLYSWMNLVLCCLIIINEYIVNYNDFKTWTSFFTRGKSIGSIESKWIKRIKNTVDICGMEIFTFYLY